MEQCSFMKHLLHTEYYIMYVKTKQGLAVLANTNTSSCNNNKIHRHRGFEQLEKSEECGFWGEEHLSYFMERGVVCF